MERVRSSLDRQNAKDIISESIPQGSFITYSFERLADHNINPLLALRLLGERYLHFALVVDNQGRKEVLEWRFSPIKEFVDYKIRKLAFGYIYSIPIQEYIEIMSEKKAVFRIFYPPREQYTPFIREKVMEFNYVYCTQFAFGYAKKVMGLNLSPLFYIPSRCASELRNSGWREEYYIYTK